MSIQFTPVNSSQISGYHYNAQLQTLSIRFNRGGVYEYSNVPPEVSAQVFNAVSVGSEFSRVIKTNPGKYPFRKIG